ncbi:iron complex outermembrane receptor protein [Novosphingobium sp. PhB165]|nr:iron complex outermembrane receptor protein [Novosphingobium sp. PhB165]
MMCTSLRARRFSLTAGVALTSLMPACAFAQEESSQPQASGDNQIVVTGTLIRGIAPAGSNVVGITEEQSKVSGGTSTNEVLASLPQVSNFFGIVPAGVSPVSGANSSNPIARPNLRALPAANTSGGAQTLVLIDGRRVVGAGTQQLAVDPDIIPPAAVERVEAMLDGGSAVYGSDALGGVLNFMTRKTYDGVKVDARVGIGDDFTSYDSGVIAGKTWDGGGLYVAYNFSKHDAIFGSDRKWVKRIDWNTGVPVGRNCADPTVSIGSNTYLVSGRSLVSGGPNTCDPSDDTVIYPAAELHSAMARFTQELGSSLNIDITALYANRQTRGNGGALGTLGNTTGTVTLTPSNPNYIDAGGADAGKPQTVRFNYASVDGYRSQTQKTDLETWSIAPSLTYDMGSNWQARALFNYGNSRVSYQNNLVDPIAQAAALANGTLNPYNLAATNPGVLSDILDGYEQGYGRNELFNYRFIVDGPLFKLPGGDLRAALGAEYMRDIFQRQTTDANLRWLPRDDYTQTVKSLFGELQAPIVTGGGAGLSELIVSASARYDKYNDFGDTFNPKFALTYKPIDWISIRANWGKSFTAPSPVDQLGPQSATATLIPGQYLSPPPGQSFATGETGVYLGNGSVTGLTPQKATSWSIGATIEPPVVDGLTLSASYYVINLNGTIGRPVTGTGLTDFYNNFPNLWTYRPTGQQLAQILSGLANPNNIGFTLLNPTSTDQALVSVGGSGATPVGVALDTLVRNLGKTDLSGIDFDASYVLDTSFASFDARIAGNIRLKQDTKASPTAALVDDLMYGMPKTKFTASLGTTIDKLRAQVTLYHVSGFERADKGQPSAFGQTRLGAFDTVDLYFRYNFAGTGVTDGLALSLNVKNVLNEVPPVYKNVGQNGYDPSNAFTLGRVFQLGVEKSF